MTTPKLPPPPRKRPEQVGVLRFGRGDEAAVGQHHVRFEQIVDGEPVLAAEIAVAAAQASAPRRRSSRRSPNGTASPKA